MSRIRPAVAGDAPAISAVHVRSWRAAYREWFPEGFVDSLDRHAGLSWWERVLVDSRLSVVVVEVDGRPSGFCLAGPAQGDGATSTPRTGEVMALYVEPRAWGQGHGRALVDASISSLRDRGCTEAVLWVLEGNERARSFYESVGWRPDGADRPADLFGPGAREVRYRRRV